MDQEIVYVHVANTTAEHSTWDRPEKEYLTGLPPILRHLIKISWNLNSPKLHFSLCPCFHLFRRSRLGLFDLLCFQAIHLGVAAADAKRDFAWKQLNYALNSTGRSFVVGFDVNPPDITFESRLLQLYELRWYVQKSVLTALWRIGWRSRWRRPQCRWKSKCV